MSTNIGNEKAIITIEVELVSSVKGDPVSGTQDTFFEGIDPSDIRDVIAEEVNASIKDEIGNALKDEGVETENLKELTDMIGDIKGEGIDNLTKFATSPQGFLEHGLIRVLGAAGPYGAVAVALIALIASAPEMTKVIIEALGVKGGPLNQDFAWTEDEQYNQQFDRVIQFRRLTGDDPVITVLTKGFVVGDPDFIDNSLVDTNIARTARVNLRDSSLGMIHGI